MGSFNTVNGKYYCNLDVLEDVQRIYGEGFNTVNGKYYCNLEELVAVAKKYDRFQYRKR